MAERIYRELESSNESGQGVKGNLLEIGSKSSSKAIRFTISSN